MAILLTFLTGVRMFTNFLAVVYGVTCGVMWRTRKGTSPRPLALALLAIPPHKRIRPYVSHHRPSAFTYSLAPRLSPKFLASPILRLVWTNKDNSSWNSNSNWQTSVIRVGVRRAGDAHSQTVEPCTRLWIILIPIHYLPNYRMSWPTEIFPSCSRYSGWFWLRPHGPSVLCLLSVTLTWRNTCDPFSFY